MLNISAPDTEETGGHQAHNDEVFGPWNPGIQSTLPSELLPYVTLLNPRNILQTLDEVQELSEFCGLGIEEVAALRPERLVVHELLIRVCANYSVSDGDQYEDLGINFRHMAKTLFDRYLVEMIPQVNSFYDQLRGEIDRLVETELKVIYRAAPFSAAEKDGWFSRLFRRPLSADKAVRVEDRDRDLVEQWQKRSQIERSAKLEKAVCFSLSRVIGSVLIRHGRIRGEEGILRKLVVNHVCNSFGSAKIGEKIEPAIERGAQQLGYRTLPLQHSPVIMNIKGASAAGKSTLRPLQQKLVAHLGLKWQDFALISPDIFRKFLLDYASLGDAYKYAGTCSGQELQIVDQKLDLYMANKARNHTLPHLLIDRFRFDSFAAKSSEEGSNLLTRFGSKVFMFYMITPPHATVERAWKRGVQVGRFKPVDDLLDHNIEAFNGMPQIFFTWALNQDKDVFYEFLDNSVALGERPRTVAFGQNGELKILDVDRMIDINRFQKINVNAGSAEEVYMQHDPMDMKTKLKFIASCVKRLKLVEFCDFESGEIYARISHGENVQLDMQLLQKYISSAEIATALGKLLSNIDRHMALIISPPNQVDLDSVTKLGRAGKQ